MSDCEVTGFELSYESAKEELKSINKSIDEYRKKGGREDYFILKLQEDAYYFYRFIERWEESRTPIETGA